MSNSETAQNGNGSVALLRCPTCNCKIVVQRTSGEIVVLQRAIVIRGGRVFGSCPQCKTEVLVEAMSYKSHHLIVSNRESQDESQDLRKDLTISGAPVKIGS